MLNPSHPEVLHPKTLPRLTVIFEVELTGGKLAIGLAAVSYLPEPSPDSDEPADGNSSRLDYPSPC